MDEPKTDSASGEFLILGNDPALDLLNTTPVLATGPVDLLSDYAGLTRWLSAAGLATASASAALAERWQATRNGTMALAEAKHLREDLRNFLVAYRSGTTVRDKWIETLNSVLSRGPAYQSIQWNSKSRRFIRLRTHQDGGAVTPIILIAEAITALLAEKDLTLIKKCGNPACVLWFYDTSKNHTRRWCSMDLCGNRAKVAAHYHRHANSQN
jgi:predicted RNA-binding Zn ribbon-like protein